MLATSTAVQIVRILQQAGHVAYFAGGWVRDFLVGHPSADIDIATSASVEQICSLFPKTIPVGISFGVVIVVIDSFFFEVATFRTDHGYLDGRRPSSVHPSTPEEDAKRRDFTINGMFYDPILEILYDFVGGQEDLKRKIIRAIGDPHERFAEDRLRMIRGIRYATRFDFPIEENTQVAIQAHAQELLPAVAIERIWQEFKKMATSARFPQGLLLLHSLGLLPTIFPSLRNISIDPLILPLFHYPLEVPPIALLLVLFPSAEEQRKLCDYLKLSHEERRIVPVLHLARSLLSDAELVQWAHFYADPLSAVCLDILAAHERDKPSFLSTHTARRHLLQKSIERILSKQPVVGTALLIQEGILPGKQLGQLLREAERIAINQQIEDPQKILFALKNTPLWIP